MGEEHIGYQIKMLNHMISRKVMCISLKNGMDQVTLMHGWIIAWLYENQDKDIFQKDLETAVSYYEIYSDQYSETDGKERIYQAGIRGLRCQAEEISFDGNGAEDPKTEFPGCTDDGGAAACKGYSG